MRIPKRLNIMGYVFRVKYAKNLPFSGSFDTMNRVIMLDEAHPNLSEVLFHEVTEVVMCMMHLNKDYGINRKTMMPTRRKFVLHHYGDRDDFTTFCTTLYDTLRRNKLI